MEKTLLRHSLGEITFILEFLNPSHIPYSLLSPSATQNLAETNHHFFFNLLLSSFFIFIIFSELCMAEEDRTDMSTVAAKKLPV